MLNFHSWETHFKEKRIMTNYWDQPKILEEKIFPELGR